MNNLQKALMANAIFSMISGLALTFFPSQFAHWFNVTNFIPFLVVGIGLIGFSISVFYESIKQRRSQVNVIITMDIIWVVASLAFILLNPFQVSFLGNEIIGMVALMVLIFAITQRIFLIKKGAQIFNKKRRTKLIVTPFLYLPL